MNLQTRARQENRSLEEEEEIICKTKLHNAKQSHMSRKQVWPTERKMWIIKKLFWLFLVASRLLLAHGKENGPGKLWEKIRSHFDFQLFSFLTYLQTRYRRRVIHNKFSLRSSVYFHFLGSASVCGVRLHHEGMNQKEWTGYQTNRNRTPM